MIRSLLLFVFSLLFVIPAFSQRTCGTVENYNQMILKNPDLKNQFEKTSKDITDRSEITKRRTQVVVIIPVVVHFNYKNEAI